MKKFKYIVLINTQEKLELYQNSTLVDTIALNVMLPPIEYFAFILEENPKIKSLEITLPTYLKFKSKLPYTEVSKMLTEGYIYLLYLERAYSFANFSLPTSSAWEAYKHNYRLYKLSYQQQVQNQV